MDIKEIIYNIRNGKIDVNNRQNIFSTIIKGLIVNLNKDISVRDIPVPHIILHTGDDTLYLENKNIDYSGTSIDQTNENYIYNIIPRCHITPGGIDFVTDQLTSPYALGNLQMEYGNSIYSLVGEFRRLPFKFACELKYYTDSYTDALELIQQIATKMTFIRTFKVVYLGQTITCSYKIPESYQGEYMTDLDGMTQDNRSKTISLSLEIESNLPIFENRTIMDPSKCISNSGSGHDLLAHGKDGIKNNEPYEIIKWNTKTGNSN
jgi:hypothetical protein